MTPATTVLQPESTTVRQQTSLTGAQSTVIQSAYKPLEAGKHEVSDSREDSTAHTQQLGVSQCKIRLPRSVTF